MTTSKSSAPDRASVADQLHSAAIRLLRSVAREDVSSGVSPAQLSALSVLVFGGPQTLNSLAAAERVRAPTMSRLVGELEKRGLAERTTAQGDRRAVRIIVTDEGRRLFEEGRRRRLARLEGSLAEATQEELAVLARAAEIIVRVAGRTPVKPT
jgi:DNA-binding MarR family transcriptional regulator